MVTNHRIPTSNILTTAKQINNGIATLKRCLVITSNYLLRTAAADHLMYTCPLKKQNKKNKKQKKISVKYITLSTFFEKIFLNVIASEAFSR